MKLEITPTSIYVGPSIHAEVPVVCFAVAGSGPHPPPFSPARLALLYGALPRLGARQDICGAPDCFTDDSSPAAGIAHLFEHVCIELQNLAGAELSCVRPQALSASGPADAAVPCEDSEVCVAAGKLAGDLLSAIASPAPGATPGADPGAAIAGPIEEFLAFAVKAALPVQDRALARAACARDIPVMRLMGRVLVLGHGRFQRRLSATKTSLTSIVSNDLAANKDYSRRLLVEVGLPVPRYERVYSVRSAVESARRIGYPVVVKPNNSGMGAGVSVGMKDRQEVRDAYRRAREFDRSVLVEEVIEGADYRMLVIDGRLQAAARRVPAHIVGDGVQTVEELVAEVNRDPRRGSGPTCSWTRITLDDQADFLLAKLGYTHQAVPPPGAVVYLRRNANTSAGGTAVDVTDEVHPDNREIAERAARAIGLDIAGVDVLTRDISTSMWENGGRICEINSRPGMRKHLWPAGGKSRDVLMPVIDMLFPRDRPARMPIFAITGTGDTGLAAHLLARVLGSGGRHVGLSAAGRVWTRARRAGNADLSGPAAVRSILLDPDLDTAVLEMPPDDVLRDGLGCDAVSVVLVISAEPGAEGGCPGKDSTGQVLDGIRVVARSARDVVYVAGPAAWADAIGRDRGRAEHCRVVAGPDGECVALGPGGTRVSLHRGVITIGDTGGETGRIPVAEIARRQPDPVAAQFARCALCVVAAASGFGMAPGDIEVALRAFEFPAAHAD